MKFYSAQQLGIWPLADRLKQREPILTFPVACAWVKIFGEVVPC